MTHLERVKYMFLQSLFKMFIISENLYLFLSFKTIKGTALNCAFIIEFSL